MRAPGALVHPAAGWGRRAPRRFTTTSVDRERWCCIDPGHRRWIEPGVQAALGGWCAAALRRVRRRLWLSRRHTVDQLPPRAAATAPAPATAAAPAPAPATVAAPRQSVLAGPRPAPLCLA